MTEPLKQRLTSPQGRLVLAGAALAAVLGIAGVAGQAVRSPGAGPSGTTMEPLLALDVLLKLGLVIALVYASAWLLRRGPFAASLRDARRHPLELVDTLSLGPQRAVHLIRVGRRSFLVGSTASQITRLGELDEEEMEGGQDDSGPFALPLDRPGT